MILNYLSGDIQQFSRSALEIALDFWLPPDGIAKSALMTSDLPFAVTVD
jgi:hypothetical protein